MAQKFAALMKTFMNAVLNSKTYSVDIEVNEASTWRALSRTLTEHQLRGVKGVKLDQTSHVARFGTRTTAWIYKRRWEVSVKRAGSGDPDRPISELAITVRYLSFDTWGVVRKEVARLASAVAWFLDAGLLSCEQCGMNLISEVVGARRCSCGAQFSLVASKPTPPASTPAPAPAAAFDTDRRSGLDLPQGLSPNFWNVWRGKIEDGRKNLIERSKAIDQARAAGLIDFTLAHSITTRIVPPVLLHYAEGPNLIEEGYFKIIDVDGRETSGTRISRPEEVRWIARALEQVKVPTSAAEAAEVTILIRAAAALTEGVPYSDIILCAIGAFVGADGKRSAHWHMQASMLRDEALRG